MINQKILVTGGTGFIGGSLCERLARDGQSVRALVRDPARADELRRWGVEVTTGDLRDLRSLERAAQGTTTVYHIAASFREARATRKEMWDTNVQGTKNMLDAAIKAGARRFVHCSTVGVHGNITHPPANEETPFAEIEDNDYQQSKLEAERVVRRYIADGRVPATIFRPSGAHGPGDLRFLKLFKAIAAGRFIMIGSGEQLYHMIYIDDLIDGILLCGTKAEAIGHAYILANDEVVTLNQLAQTTAEVLGMRPPRLHVPFAPVYIASVLCEWLCKPFGLAPPLYRRRVDFFRANRAFSIAKAKRELGFQPKVDFRTGLQRTAEWYKEHGLL